MQQERSRSIENPRTEQKLLTVAEFASLLHLSVSTIRSWVAANRIEYVKLGGRIFFRREYCDELIESRTVQASA